MDATPPPSTLQPSAAKHTRQGSIGRVLPKRPVRGALDISKSPIHTAQASSSLSPSKNSTGNSRLSPNRSSLSYSSNLNNQSPSRIYPSSPGLSKDFSALLHPSLYHTLTPIDIPPPLRNLALQPDTSTSLTDLISSGHFRSAAVKAAQTLTIPGQSLNPGEIFDLVYRRLACLTLCNQTAIAAQEVKALGDLNSAHYRDVDTGKHLIPWELRLLAVRLQGIGFGDSRRSVMGYYELVDEARLNLSSLKKEVNRNLDEDDVRKAIEREISLWEYRLGELGIRVASALIEMEDSEGATCFLASIQSCPSTRYLLSQRALLHLHLGDIAEAHRCAPDDKLILALSNMAAAQYNDAIKCWEELIDTNPNSKDLALWKQNMAVSLIYLGRLDEARTFFESLLDDDGHTFHALTFNLSTVYELSTERSRALKITLAERVAKVLESNRDRAKEACVPVVGWEKVNSDFKL
ncbi:hypothetical protein BGHDH14_bgh01823 [Blumeria hordei DH14]|uniref:Uncharacterized protein n=1 Tax=Blumeria graminis f. sp. hordei (strain DH14) TaxID=546991 RepID=N1J9T0_BLUG1|nr:hypothetical protein BGHDH14_bgh01823 [Blumeria hordei DH14]